MSGLSWRQTSTTRPTPAWIRSTRTSSETLRPIEHESCRTLRRSRFRGGTLGLTMTAQAFVTPAERSDREALNVNTDLAPFPSMVWIPGGTFRMGSDKHYPEERPVHRVTVDGFWMDRAPLTNARFARFVEATGHVTFAENAPRPRTTPARCRISSSRDRSCSSNRTDRRSPGFHQLVALGARGRLAAPARPRQQHRWARASSCRSRHVRRCRGVCPVGRQIAAQRSRVGVRGARRPRRRRLRLGRRVLARRSPLANTWQGEFPWQSLVSDGYEGTSPAGVFAPNGYGLYDMIGNVWEWTTDWYQPKHPAEVVKACCIPHNPRGPVSKTATTRASRRSGFRARCSRGDRISARRTTAGVTGRRRGFRSRSTRRRAMSASAASSGRRKRRTDLAELFLNGRGVVSPTWQEIGELGAIAAIRTFLNYFLEHGLEKAGV